MCIENIKPKEVFNYINVYNVIIIDLRDKEDYDSGHIPSAINIPHEDIMEKIHMLYNYTLILYCERGNTSLSISRNLLEKGYKVKNLYGGMNMYKFEVKKMKRKDLISYKERILI